MKDYYDQNVKNYGGVMQRPGSVVVGFMRNKIMTKFLGKIGKHLFPLCQTIGINSRK